jgi:hypothetical protein
MERESCLLILITLVGGATVLACGFWPVGGLRESSGRRLERITWRRVWLPLMPALAAVAWLCGWALAEPDPIPEKFPISLLLISFPFAALCARAAFRAAWALFAKPDASGPTTVGLLMPSTILSPHLAKLLNPSQIGAVLEHECAHARHRDPLRIWLAQFATDLQWPWPQARARLHEWLIALELARDEEARAAGADGCELADAILISLRFSHAVDKASWAGLTGAPSALKERVARLLEPLSADAETRTRKFGMLLTMLPAVWPSLALGIIFGEPVIRALFWFAG